MLCAALTVFGTGVAGIAAGPFVAVCALLAIAGFAKLANPRAAHAAITAAGWRVPEVAARALGAAEIGVGVAGCMVAARAALIVAAIYLALAGFAWRLLRRAPATPCACVGSSGAPVSRVHLLVDCGAAAIAIAAATGGSPFAPLDGRPFASVVFIALVACCVKLGALTLDALPLLTRATKEGAS